MIEPITECVVDTGSDKSVAIHNHAPDPTSTDIMASMNKRRSYSVIFSVGNLSNPLDNVCATNL
jgi:hypothetical protein